jgi:hypothetical protein
MLAARVLSTMAMVSVSWSSRVRWMSLKRLKEASSDRLDLALEQDRQDDDVERRRLPEAGGDVDVVAGDVAEEDALLLVGALADQPLADPELVGQVLALAVGVGAGQAERGGAVDRLHHVEDAMLGRHHRGQLRQDQLGHVGQVALALEHAGELGEVGLEPVLLGVLLGGVLEVADHLVDVVLQGRHLALGLEGDRAGEVALGDGGGDLGDGPHLGGEVGGQLVDVLRQRLPRPGRPGNLRLAAQTALDAHFAGHRRDLVGERRQGVNHLVDRVGQGRDLALGLDD